MSKAEKFIENEKAKVQKKIEALRDEANEAYANWADTGYQRYMSKHDRLLEEADTLESFIKPNSDRAYYERKIVELNTEIERLNLLLKSVENVVNEEMIYSFPDCHETRRLQDIVSKWKWH